MTAAFLISRNVIDMRYPDKLNFSVKEYPKLESTLYLVGAICESYRNLELEYKRYRAFCVLRPSEQYYLPASC